MILGQESDVAIARADVPPTLFRHLRDHVKRQEPSDPVIQRTSIETERAVVPYPESLHDHAIERVREMPRRWRRIYSQALGIKFEPRERPAAAVT